MKMLIIATTKLYDADVHGEGGPVGHYLVDTTWSRKDVFKPQLFARASKQSLRVEFVTLYDEGLYAACIINPAFKIFQKKLKRRYGTATT
jgi:hypothetical protein